MFEQYRSDAPSLVAVELPADLLQRRVPHLAFFDEPYFDRVVGKVQARNARFRRSDDPAADPCLRRPRKHSRCPGGVTECGVCGRPYVWGGNGQPDHLMCSGARENRCWNGVTFDGPEAARRVAAVVLSEAERLPDFDPAFLELVNDEVKRLDAARIKQIEVLGQAITQTDREIANVIRVIRRSDAEAQSPALAEELRGLERRQAAQRAELECARRAPSDAVHVPPVEEVRRLARAGLGDLARLDKEFAETFSKLVPRLTVVPPLAGDGVCGGGLLGPAAPFPGEGGRGVESQVTRHLGRSQRRELGREPSDLPVVVDQRSRLPRRLRRE